MAYLATPARTSSIARSGARCAPSTAGPGRSCGTARAALHRRLGRGRGREHRPRTRRSGLRDGAAGGTAAYVHGTHFTSDVIEEYAARLAKHAPGDCNRLYLVSGGSEANETAVKLARAYHLANGQRVRYKVVRRSISLPRQHPRDALALGSSEPPSALQADAALVPETPRAVLLPLPAGQELPGLRDRLRRRARGRDPARRTGDVFRPSSPSRSSARRPEPPSRPRDYARRAREICTQHGVLYIDDEVMTGFGRTGKWFGIEWSGALPDIVTCGKGMTGGYMPVGAVLASERIVATLAKSGRLHRTASPSHTTPSPPQPLSKTLDILEAEHLVERSRADGREAAGAAATATDAPARRRRAGPRPDDRDRAGRRQGDEEAVPALGEAGRGRRGEGLRGRPRHLPRRRLRRWHRTATRS